ncbi:MAG: hypothetical protein H6844_02580 [Alphaproteobacteria bacterium]|nr:hypothetical protein [Alphaproteobacteria bacterium]
MTPPVVLDLDYEWLDEDDEEFDEDEGLGDLFYRDAKTGHYTQVAAIHLPHFIALYESDEDLLN